MQTIFKLKGKALSIKSILSSVFESLSKEKTSPSSLYMLQNLNIIGQFFLLLHMGLQYNFQQKLILDQLGHIFLYQ